MTLKTSLEVLNPNPISPESLSQSVARLNGG